jgi:hypothetical protein
VVGFATAIEIRTTPSQTARALPSVRPGLLYNISAHDPRVFIITLFALVVVTLLAASLPAWRATPGRFAASATLRMTHRQEMNT